MLTIEERTNGNGTRHIDLGSETVALEQVEPYADSLEHLRDELCRVEQLVRAQTVRWWHTVAADKPEQLWGMVHVSDAEIERFLRAPFELPASADAAVQIECEAYQRTAAQLAQLIELRIAHTPPETELRFEMLCARFDLAPLDRDLLLLCLLPEAEPRYRRLFGYLQDDASRHLPSVELLLQIARPSEVAAGDGWGALAAKSVLRANHLLRLAGDPRDGEAPPARFAAIDGRVSAFLLGGDALDDRLVGVVEWASDAVVLADLLIPPELAARLGALAEWWHTICRPSGTGAAVVLQALPGGGRLRAAQMLAHAAGVPLLRANVARALGCPASWELAVELIYREARLCGAAVYWDGCDQLIEEGGQRYSALLRADARFDGFSFLALTSGHNLFEQPVAAARTVIHLHIPPPDYRLRQRIWDLYLRQAGALAEPAPSRAALAELLAGSFQLTEGQIRSAMTIAGAQALLRDPLRARITVDDLYDGCRRQTGQRLMAMARRIEPRTGLSFDDLVMPRANRRQLDELRQRVRRRNQVYGGLGFEKRMSLGRGLITLFSGSSGTGKTMAAELLAREQGVDLYKIDMSAVVSKYVGETEKNLSRIFAEAEDANAILFFDEADALFGKRGEVKEARDRWANMETNYLLQRVEEYAGIVVLASNLRQNIDEAFLRRIHVVVEFPAPDAEARFRIWRGMFPEGLGRPSDEELRAVAEQFRLSGGNIKNIVIDAAYRALGDVGDGQPQITLGHLLAGTAREYQKLGKPITKGEFSAAFYALLDETLLA